MFTQTDLNLTHRIRFGNDNRFAVAFDFNVINVFNQNTPISFAQNKTSGYWALSESDVVASGTTVDATNFLTSNGVLAQYAATEPLICASATVCGTSVARSASFGQPLTFQEPRSIRFGFRFIF